MSRDDELAETAAADTSALAPAPASSIGDWLGRYRLDRVLGAGGMGVVHAAFDPELQRHIALKVLKQTSGADDADRARLLREARAMARVKHPNVVTVYEAGSDQGRDFVAMELVDGVSLAEWLRAPHGRREILDTFLAAGRGLAAAHAAGLVHRDFKPANVLRDRSGRVLVGDFGLARGIEGEVAPRASVAELGVADGLTATGSLLGTPAYMAPEQWHGGEVGPPADQFAFCVALWEALAGERPFRGDTLEDLRRAVEAGPAGLDASRLPRALREPLHRGLQVDPARRWPHLDDLLARLGRRGARRVAAGAGVVAAAAVAATLVVIAHRAPPATAACVPSIEDLVRGAHGRAALLRDLLATGPRYVGACAAASSPRRAAALACLDGVRARADAIGAAADRRHGKLEPDAIAALAVDPAVCDRDPAPRLRVTATADLLDALGLALDPHADSAAALALAKRPAIAPCARAIALELAAQNTEDTATARTAASEALDAAEPCGDDHVHADALIAIASSLADGPTALLEGEAASERARVAVEHLGDPEQGASLDVVRARIALSRGSVDGMVAALTRALAELDRRGMRTTQLDAVRFLDYARFLRSSPDDLAAIRANVTRWRPIAVALGDAGRTGQLDRDEALARFYAGDARGVRDALSRAWHQGTPGAGRITGVVRDAAGRPVAGALVIAGSRVFADDTSIWFPLEDSDGEQRQAVADGSGHFTIDLGGGNDLVVAQAGPLRSLPVRAADHLELAVLPTRAVDGHVQLGALPSTHVQVWATPAAWGDDAAGPTYRVTAPLAADGTFHIAGVPTGKLIVTAHVQDGAHDSTVKTLEVAAGAGPARIELALASGNRTVVVIVRSTLLTKLDGAYLDLIPGDVPVRGIDDLLGATKARGGCRTMMAQHASELSGLPAAALQPGDLAARFDHLADGDYTLCAVGLNGDFTNKSFVQRLWSHAHAMKIACKTIRGNAGMIVVEAPPQNRFD